MISKMMKMATRAKPRIYACSCGCLFLALTVNLVALEHKDKLEKTVDGWKLYSSAGRSATSLTRKKVKSLVNTAFADIYKATADRDRKSLVSKLGEPKDDLGKKRLDELYELASKTGNGIYYNYFSVKTDSGLVFCSFVIGPSPMPPMGSTLPETSPTVRAYNLVARRKETNPDVWIIGFYDQQGDRVPKDILADITGFAGRLRMSIMENNTEKKANIPRPDIEGMLAQKEKQAKSVFESKEFAVAKGARKIKNLTLTYDWNKMPLDDKNELYVRQMSQRVDKQMLSQCRKELESYGPSLSVQETFALFNVEFESEKIMEDNKLTKAGKLQAYELLYSYVRDQLIDDRERYISKPGTLFAKDAKISHPTEKAIGNLKWLRKAVTQNTTKEREIAAMLQSRSVQSTVVAEGGMSILDKRYKFVYLVTSFNQKTPPLDKTDGTLFVLERPIEEGEWRISDDFRFSTFLRELRRDLVDVEAVNKEPLSEVFRPHLSRDEFKTFVYPVISRHFHNSK